MRIALPDGSLRKKTTERFAKAGIKIPDQARKHEVTIESVPELTDGITSDHLTVFWLNPWDIPGAIFYQFADCGIVGQDIEEEWRLGNKERFKACTLFASPPLKYSKSGDNKEALLALLGPAYGVNTSKDPTTVFGKVFTRFPLLAKSYLPEAEIVYKRGAIEAWVGSCKCNWCVGLGVEIVDSGKSLRANRLRVLSELRRTSPILFQYLHATFRNPLVERKVDLLTRILIG